MEQLKFLRSTQIIILGVCIAFATIVSAIILSKGLLNIIKFKGEVIEVTGSAEKKITSDYISWNASFSCRDTELKVAYEKAQEDLEKVRQYLKAKDVEDEEIVVSQIQTEILYKKNEKGNDTNEIEGYRLSQGIEVKSPNVKQIEDVSRQSTELINQDVQFISQAPQYFYTRLSELKIEMLARATDDAKQRAISMANSTGSSIGMMRSAKMGIFQITPVNSYDVSWYGKNDTSSYEKKVTAVVNANFSIE